MYKQIFKTVINMCIFYTILLSIIFVSAFSLLSSKEMKASIESEMNHLESEFKSLNTKSKIILDDVLANEYVRSYVNDNNKLAKYYFQTDLRKFADFDSPGISNIAVYREGDKEAYSSNSTMTLDYYARSIGLTREKFIAETNRIKNTSIVRTTDYLVFNDKFTMLTCCKTTFDKVVYLMVTFDMGEMISSLENADKELFIFKDNTLVYGTDPAHEKLANKVADGERSLLYYDDSFDMFLSESEVPLRVVGLSRKSVYISLYTRMIIFMLMFIICVFVIGYFWSNNTTKKMYAPIKALLGNINDMPDTVENEFEAIKEFIDELKNKNFYMQEHMRKTEDDKFLLSVLLNECDEKYAKEYIVRHRLANSVMAVAVLEYTDFNSFYKSFTEEELFLFKGMIKDMLNEKFSAYTYYNVINLMPDNFVFVYSVDDGVDSFKDLADVIDIIDRKFSVKLSACVGETVYSFMDLYKSYNDSLYISKCINLQMDEGRIFTKKDIIDRKSNGFIFPIEVEKALLMAALAFDMKTVKENIHFIIRANSSEAGQSDECLIQLATMFSATCAKLLSEFNLSVKQVFGEDISVYLELRQASTFAELEETASELIEQILNHSATVYDKGFKSIKDSIEQFIENNYQKDISLGDLARHLNLSETYVSKLFKSSIGKNFKEYLMFYKYTKAKEIMKENPTYKLKDVAQMVGCNTPLTLSRLLKKYDKED